MSIASEITRLQGVKSNILQAISDKGVDVPAGSALDDCPDLIASISGGGGDFVEIDGRRYPTVKIGPLIWTTENLDWKLPGIEIGNTSPSSSYARACYYNNDEAAHGVNGDKWGLLYNTKAVQAIEQSGLLPEGFRIPTKNDFDGLITLPSIYLTKDGTNYFGFDVLDSGGLFGGSFVEGGNCAYMWCQTDDYYFSIKTSGASSGNTDSKHGMSLRLCKDA